MEAKFLFNFHVFLELISYFSYTYELANYAIYKQW